MKSNGILRELNSDVLGFKSDVNSDLIEGSLKVKHPCYGFLECGGMIV